MKGFITVFLVLVVSRTCETCDFNGFMAGYINAETTDSEARVIVTGQFDNSIVNCTADTVGSVVIENVNVTCHGGNCPQSINFTCTDYNAVDGWTVARSEFVIPTTNGISFSLKSSTTPRHVNNRINSTGRILFAKIGPNETFATFGGQFVYNLKQPCTAEIRIPVDDLEDKQVTCEWDTDHCGDFCPGIPEMTLDKDACTLNSRSAFTGVPHGNHVIVLKVKNNGSDTSQMPLHILLTTKFYTRRCTQNPTFHSASNDGTCFQLFPGDTFQEKITLQTFDAADQITAIRTTNFIGMTKTPVQKVPGVIDQYFTEITYNTSTVSRIDYMGAQMLCVTGRDSMGSDSKTACYRIIIVTDNLKKMFKLTPRYPNPAFLGMDIKISFIAPVNVSKSAAHADLKVYSASNGSLVKQYQISTDTNAAFSGNTFSYTFPDGTLTEGTYYVTLDNRAISLRERYCKLFSMEFNDSTVTFDVVQRLTLTFLSNFTSSGTNATILWKFSKDVVSSACVVLNPKNQITHSNCSKEWMGSDLIIGNYTLTVTASDKIGLNVSSTYVWTVDTTPPKVECSGTPDSVTAEKTVNVSCTCNESCSAMCRVVDEGSAVVPDYVSCSSLVDQYILYTTSISTHNASYGLDIAATDSAGNTAMYPFRWRTDFELSAITCTNTLPPINNNATANIICQCGENCSAQCRLFRNDMPSPPTSCSTLDVDEITYSTSTLYDSFSYKLEIIGSDKYGNKGTHHIGWKTDRAPPTISCLGTPESVSMENYVNISCTCSENCSAQCRVLDEDSVTVQDLVSCSDISDNIILHNSSNLSHNKSYRIEVFATDAVGNTGDFKFNFLTDFIAPNITCQKLPAAVSKNTSIDIICSCNENCSATCRIVKKMEPIGLFVHCSNLTEDLILYSTTGLLGNTTYELEVKAKDEAGNANTFQYEFKTDYTKPNVTFTLKPRSPSSERYENFKFVCNEACKTKCMLQNGSSSTEFEDCGGPLTMDTKTFRTPYLLTSLNYTLKVTPTDAAGNEGETEDFTWTSDMVPPIGTIVKSPPLFSNESDFELIVSCNEPSITKCSMERQGTSPNYTDCGGELSGDPKSYRTPSLVTNTINVFSFYCIDEAANNGTPQTYQWTSDFDAPNITCSKLPALISKDKSFEFICTCNETCSAVCQSVKEKQLDEQFTSCSTFTQEKISHSTTNLLDNTIYIFQVKATDKAGNMKSFAYQWKTDHVKPNVTIIQKPTSPSKDRYVDFKFVCNEACKTKCSLNNGSSSTELEECGGQLSTSTKIFKTPYLHSALNYTLSIVPTDEAGNVGDSHQVTWTTDMDPPNCAIVKKPASKSNETVAEFSFTCSEPSTAKCSLKKQGESPSFVDCGGTSLMSKTYSTQTLVTATTYIFKVYCIDTAGNNGNAQTYEWDTDFDKPTCTFTKKPPANSSATNVEFTITCNEATRLSCAIKKGNLNAMDRTCGSAFNTLARSFTTKMLESGYMYKFTVYSTDIAGNIGDAISHDWYTKITTSLTARLNMQVSDDPNNHDIYNTYVNKVKNPLKATKISSIRKGSLIINYDTDPDNWSHVLGLVEKGSVVIDGAIIPVQSIQLQTKTGEEISISTLLNPCVLYEQYKSCPAQAPCEVDGQNNARCSTESLGTSKGVIGLAVGIVVFFFLLGAALLVIFFRKSAIKNKAKTEQLRPYHDTQDNLKWSWYQPRFNNIRFIDVDKMAQPYKVNGKN